ncbi:MAG: cytochrome c oxidase subunit 3 family protein [Bacteroidota bacterium]
MHRDDEGSKIGMWLFIFTEILLFGGLFVVYSVYRYLHPEAFKLAADELDWVMGTINTVILLVSSMTIAMSISAIQKNNKKFALQLLYATAFLAIVFMVNKYFEWGAKFEHGFYPSSEVLHELGFGTILYFGLYFMMTGLHALHIIIGLVVIGFIIVYVRQDKITHDNHQLLENGGLYWHLVDLIWIFLFPLFYLIH